MRYANTRGLCELMANACNIFPPYSESIRECLLEINKTAEKNHGAQPLGRRNRRRAQLAPPWRTNAEHETGGLVAASAAAPPRPH